MVVLGPWIWDPEGLGSFPQWSSGHLPSFLCRQFFKFLPRKRLQQQTFTAFSLVWWAFSCPGDVSAQYSPEMHHNMLGWSFRLGKAPKSPISFHVFHAKLFKGFAVRPVKVDPDPVELPQSQERKGRKLMFKAQTLFLGSLWGFSLVQHLLGLRITSYVFELVVSGFWPDLQGTQESLSLVLKVNFGFPFSVLNKQQHPERAPQVKPVLLGWHSFPLQSDIFLNIRYASVNHGIEERGGDFELVTWVCHAASTIAQKEAKHLLWATQMLWAI